MLVSVYMPTKNRLPLLRMAIQSVLEQSYSEFELIVVNDGSNDGTREFITSIANAEPRIKVIHHEKSRGPQISRNAAISLAKGAFVTGLDDDDQFLPLRIESFVSQWQMLDRAKIKRAFIYSQDELYQNGNLIGYSAKKGSVSETDILVSNEVGNQIFVRKESLLEIGGFREDLPAWQDFDLFIRLLKDNQVACLVDLPTYRFDISPRPDRISAHRPRVRRAFEMVSGTRVNLRERQQLMIQMFAGYYGFRPTLGEMWEFARMGWWPQGALTMLKRSLGKY